MFILLLTTDGLIDLLDFEDKINEEVHDYNQENRNWA